MLQAVTYTTLPKIVHIFGVQIHLSTIRTELPRRLLPCRDAWTRTHGLA
jgi:hypothetical protein